MAAKHATAPKSEAKLCSWAGAVFRFLISKAVLLSYPSRVRVQRSTSAPCLLLFLLHDETRPAPEHRFTPGQWLSEEECRPAAASEPDTHIHIQSETVAAVVAMAYHPPHPQYHTSATFVPGMDDYYTPPAPPQLMAPKPER